MFSVYDVNGRSFHDTLEALYKKRPDKPGNNPENQQNGQAPSHQINPKALDAYRKLINAQPKDELHHIYEIMNRNFTILPASISAYSALMKIQQSPFNELAVVNAHNSIIGIISYAGILDQLIQHDEELGFLKISTAGDYLSGDIITADPVTSIRRAAQVMHHYNLETLPVVDSYGTTLGTVTYKNIVSAVSNDPPISIWS